MINRVKRLLWISLGLISLVLGIMGIFLPLLPTTPFILLSALAFAESSPRLHRWLTNHPRWGVIIKNWQDGGRIDRQSKTIAVSVMAAMPILSWVLNVPWWAIGAQVLVLIAVATFILTRPS